MIRFSFGNTRCTLTFGFAAVVCAAFVFGDPWNTATVLFCIAWHECGHLLVLHLLHTPPKELRMTLFGLELTTGPRSTHRAEAMVSLAGPASNLLTAAVLFPLWKKAAALHLALGLFHLLPVLPLDGGQALQSLLCLRFSSAGAKRAAAVISAIVLLPLGTAGFWLLFRRERNFTLFLLCLYLLFYLVFKAKEE